MSLCLIRNQWWRRFPLREGFNPLLLDSPLFFCLTNCNAFYWNVRGVDSHLFPSLMRDLRSKYKFLVVFLVEPRTSGSHVSQGRNKLGFIHIHCVEAEGFSGGIWMLWEEDEFFVQILSRMTNLSMHVLIPKMIVRSGF